MTTDGGPDGSQSPTPQAFFVAINAMSAELIAEAAELVAAAQAARQRSAATRMQLSSNVPTETSEPESP
jgi:hypothetical protein